jgi:hypothetical protein
MLAARDLNLQPGARPSNEIDRDFRLGDVKCPLQPRDHHETTCKTEEVML